jgi:hypothetical protein
VANDFSDAGQHVGCRVVGVRPGLTPAQLPHIATDVDALVVDDSAGTPKLFASVNVVLQVGSELLGDNETPGASGQGGDIALVPQRQPPARRRA